jgi:hypothetical protein
VGQNNWIFLFSCNNGNLPEGYSPDNPICYKNVYSSCGGSGTFRRDTFTLEKLGTPNVDYATSPNVPAERLRALFGTNAWGIQSPDGDDCSSSFSVAPVPEDRQGDANAYCFGLDDNSNVWTPTVGSVTLRKKAEAGSSSATISPAAGDLTVFSGRTQDFTITVQNPVKSCSQLQAPIVDVDNSAIASCDVPPATDTVRTGYFAPTNAMANTCELTITCRWLLEGTTRVDINVNDWGGTSLVAVQYGLTVLGSAFTITPSSATLSKVTGSSQAFTITVTNPKDDCSGLPPPDVTVVNPAVVNPCSVPATYTSVDMGADKTCVMVIPCTMTSTAGTTGISIRARDWDKNLALTQSTTVFTVSRGDGGLGTGGERVCARLFSKMCCQDMP